MTDDEYSQHGDYLASISEDYHYAIHPAPDHPMTDLERQAAIERYQSLTLTQNQNISTMSDKTNEKQVS